VEEVRAGASRDADVEAALRRQGAPARALDAAALRPTLARTAPAPFSRPGWLFELKYDGVRALAVKAADGGVRLVVRTGADRAAVYPEVARAIARLPLSSFAIDGELVALDGAGRASFERIQRRMGLRDPREIARAAVEVPVVYYAFDLLGALGRDARALPLVRRKELLARFAPQLGVVRFADHVEGDGTRLFEAVAAHGLEGVIAKKADAPYASGRRTDHWLKIKAPRTACAAIVGWTAGQGGRARLGALLLGWWRGGELVYAGSAGSGLDERTIDALLPALEVARVPEPACAGVPDSVRRSGRFVRPERACEVRYTEETSAGLLRQPVFVRLRELDPASCNAPAAREAAKPAPSGGDPKPVPSAGAPEEPPAAPEPALQLTRLDKVFWPLEGYTKGDLLAYYEAVWPWLAPYLRDRPLVLTRYPDGIEGKSFYQHQAPPFTPDWVRRARIDDTDYFLCDDLRSLLYVVNSGAIPLHVWSARASALEHPDWLVIDLDPKGAPFVHVVEVARRLHRLLDEGGAAHFAKTSGQDGLHVLVPLAGQLDHEQARALGEVLARAVCAELPEIATIARPIASRGGRVYVDYLQNGRGKTIVSPLSVRPRPGAPVSMPLAWSQVNARLSPARFTIETAPARLARSGDPLAGALGAGVDVARLLAALEGSLRRAGAAPEPPPRPRPRRRPARAPRSAAKRGRARR
jgi:bifunctional non-homologous end joining protein LigD